MTTVEIGRRTFKVGAWYRPKNDNPKKPPRKLHALTDDNACVWWEYKFGRRTWITTAAWVRWAGDEVQPR